MLSATDSNDMFSILSTVDSNDMFSMLGLSTADISGSSDGFYGVYY